MDADRALDLAAAAKQMAQREVRLERVVVDLRHLHEQLERLVRLAVQDEIQAADVVGADARRQVAIAIDVDLVDEADRTEHDEQRGQQERGVGRHRARRVGGRVRSSASAYFRSCFSRRFSPVERHSANAGRKDAEQPAEGQRDGKRDGHRNLLEPHEADVDVDGLRVAVGEHARQQHQRDQDGGEYEPAHREQVGVLPLGRRSIVEPER